MKTDIVYTGDMASILPIHKLESLPEDPAMPGVRLIPARVGIEVLPGLVYFADATIWRSVERCAEGLRWRARPGVESGNVLNAPICVDSRGCTIGVSMAPREEQAR